MLGMYVHTHWAYNRPYAARTWTLQDWEGFLDGIARLGYDLVMVWPQLDCMPPEPMAGDRAFLGKLHQVIDLAHDRFGLKVLLTLCPNTVGNEKAAGYTFEERPYFVCEKKVNPADGGEVGAFLAARRAQLSLVGNADGIAIIDSDPGGYIGSTNAEFVGLVQAQVAVMRSLNPTAEFVYWMLAGWESYNRFWEKARDGDEAHVWEEWHGDDFVETLTLMREQLDEPWWLLGWLDRHQAAIEQLGLSDKALSYPYGVIEGEPTFPLTNWAPDNVAHTVRQHSRAMFPRGIMANAQTHCLQLPHIAAFAHFAQKEPSDGFDLVAFADRLLPGLGETIASGWSVLETHEPETQRRAAVVVRQAAARVGGTGDLGGLLFGDPERFLIDLALNLELRAALGDFGRAVEADSAPVPALRALLDVLAPYQRRTGFADAYGGALHTGFNAPLERIADPPLKQALADFTDWREPAIRNGLLLRLLDEVEAYCARHA
ncbi:MAG: hypothetical protein COZ06_10560 [Armatimonadetes bacterium CG_4_10_14_3_um_filter_66_18]|nr:hypothetical protein [Armatimonadota bacterium]OIO98214.1 MAG: hypothetical protein AUJ96_21635 [Armatimonadetes bacterium CG2_30_66_41]PIU93079.1 MAG: hypothetical protein COS65_14635 [Armatimonadetes bacterium CG06_land_8_20_14_3_00_66_21]PIX37560.1 MAG: hypothetical protein COZ57_33690 [Armatimonadetes bacterium CG_4_8_14_3_um_filter_66_20]PIY50210.1 MAG: hypothetical protein COZ06_10560 [Armatimonadetes bacterium CG_4_10_14_3_um_filter_66_18]PIZ39029.1 MAG: hypothetical protein COY42_22